MYFGMNETKNETVFLIDGVAPEKEVRDFFDVECSIKKVSLHPESPELNDDYWHVVIRK